MIAALDVQYDEARSLGHAAAVVFENWEDAVPVAEYVADIDKVLPYVPGKFFQRELPCLLALLAKFREPVRFVVIDGYVDLGSGPGLGRVLWDHLAREKTVIGVAKTRYEGSTAVEVRRGGSQAPLFVTAVGMDASEAASCLQRMHGPFRIPTLLKRVDGLARGVSR
jgi:deoxyribonuclease V